MRPQIWFVKAVLEMQDTENTDPIQQATIGMLDADLVEQVHKTSQSLIAKAPGNISGELVDAMDIFNRVTLAVKENYEHRTTKVKTPELALSFELWAHSGGWEHMFADLCLFCFTDLPGLLLLGIGGTGDEQRKTRNMKMVFHLANQLLTELSTRMLPRIFEYPYVAVGLLSGEAQRQQEVRAMVLKDFNTLLQVERVVASGSDDYMHQVVDGVKWRKQDSCRLLFNVLDLEHRLGEGNQSTHLALGLLNSMADEKPMKDFHQYVRDESRGRRHKGVPLNTIYETCITAPVFEERGMKQLCVDNDLLAKEAWYRHRKPPSERKQYHTDDYKLPDKFSGLMKPNAQWTPATVERQMQSMLSWSWCKTLVAANASGPEPSIFAKDSCFSTLPALHHVV